MTKGRGLSANALKMIAMGSMFLDHLGSGIVYHLYLEACMVDGVDIVGDIIPEEAKRLHLLYQILRIIGRIAFPVFAYLLVEGFLHTSNWLNYAKRLFWFAVISEAAYDVPWSADSFLRQNVLWTFLIGLVMLHHLRLEEHLAGRQRNGKMIRDILTAMLMAFLIQSDYSALGVLLIAVLYIYRGNYRRQAAAGTVVLVLMTVVQTMLYRMMWIQIFSVLAFVFLYFYNGERGRGNKYVFYVFYPLHLLILGLCRSLID
ncbi:TraX family protein [Roseburia hominis]